MVIVCAGTTLIGVRGLGEMAFELKCFANALDAVGITEEHDTLPWQQKASGARWWNFRLGLAEWKKGH